jgi:hypothetical protein
MACDLRAVGVHTIPMARKGSMEECPVEGTLSTQVLLPGRAEERSDVRSSGDNGPNLEAPIRRRPSRGWQAERE